jgi:hypothetical protein
MEPTNPTPEFTTRRDIPIAPKSPLKSLGVTGSGGAVLLAIATLVAAYQQTGEVPPAEAALIISTAISALIGLYGRLRAKRPVAF